MLEVAIGSQVFVAGKSHRSNPVPSLVWRLQATGCNVRGKSGAVTRYCDVGTVMLVVKAEEGVFSMPQGRRCHDVKDFSLALRPPNEL